MKVLILKGLPASGKSRFSKRFVRQNKGWVRVNRDDLRRMRGEYWVPKQEELITAWERACTIDALDMGYNVVVDSTNLNPHFLKEMKQWLWMVFEDKVEYEEKFFDTPIWLCVLRDLFRKHRVGYKVILRMYNKYLKK